MYNINSILIAIFGLIKTKPLEGSATAKGGGLMWKSVTCRIKRGNITLKRERERERERERKEEKLIQGRLDASSQLGEFSPLLSSPNLVKDGLTSLHGSP